MFFEADQRAKNKQLGVVAAMNIEAGEKAVLKKKIASYYRLPDDVIGNDLYRAKKWFDNIYSTLNAGNDLNMEDLELLIKLLEDIKNSAEKYE